MATVSSVPNQCGMSFVSSLLNFQSEDLNYQIKLLEDQIFYGPGGGDKILKAMAILTDYEDRESTHWKETKSVAFKSEWRRNPNTNRSVRTYIIYPEHLKLLRAMLPVKLADKIVEQIKS
jgi:hypothetical protein